MHVLQSRRLPIEAGRMHLRAAASASVIDRHFYREGRSAPADLLETW